MNIGAEAGMPSRLSCRTWPISWTQIRTTIPTANHTGKSKRVGPDAHQHGQRRADKFDLEQEKRKPLNFTSNTPSTARGASKRLMTLQAPSGLRGS